METPSYRLTDFEGPLDVLLHLITSHKLNILDIQIEELLQQYLCFIEGRIDRDLEIASEFLEMAARLVHIKTVSLLPRREEEADALRAQLTGELMEYRLCREAAALLAQRAADHRVFVRTCMPVESDPLYTLTHSPLLLLEASGCITGRIIRRQPPPESSFSGIVQHKTVSVASRIIHLLRMFYRVPCVQLGVVFSPGNRSELVATFLALLELIKAGRVTLSLDGTTLSFHRTKKEPTMEVTV
ncbi:MAG: ScpA family protein [Oscillospiraceae bacterium]